MDDDLIEKMTAFTLKIQASYMKKYHKKVEDFRKRITNYLNLLDKVVTQKFEAFKSELVEKEPN